MDFKFVITVLLIYFIRPQDWIPGMAGMNIVRPLMAAALLAMFARQRGFTLGSLVRTPLDWMMLAYGAYIIYFAPDASEAAKGVFVLLAFYFVTSQALGSEGRLSLFLKVWLGCLITVAGMAVLSEYGLDITGAHEITHKVPEVPRLVLNTYLFHNPNALGHSVVLAIPVAYFALFWRRELPKRILAGLLIALSVYCVILTQSKGAFLVGIAIILASQFIGRSRFVQLSLILLSLAVGSALIRTLPRMEQLENARQDEAIAGRLMVWEYARTVSEERINGEGWKSFKPVIIWEGEEQTKATHSSYVLVGAELGKIGMFFYIAVLYCGLRVLLLARCRSEEDERSRRILFILLLGYILSNWMIDRAYHSEYFLMAGAISALHRRLGVRVGILETSDAEEEEDVDEEETDESFEGATLFGTPQLAYASGIPDAGPPSTPSTSVDLDLGRVLSPIAKVPSTRQDDVVREIGDVDTSEIVEEAIEEELERIRYWRRFWLVDLLICIGLTWLVFWTWDYILLNL